MALLSRRLRKHGTLILPDRVAGDGPQDSPGTAKNFRFLLDGELVQLATSNAEMISFSQDLES